MNDITTLLGIWEQAQKTQHEVSIRLLEAFAADVRDKQIAINELVATLEKACDYMDADSVRAVIAKHKGGEE